MPCQSITSRCSNKEWPLLAEWHLPPSKDPSSCDSARTRDAVLIGRVARERGLGGYVRIGNLQPRPAKQSACGAVRSCPLKTTGSPLKSTARLSAAGVVACQGAEQQLLTWETAFASPAAAIAHQRPVRPTAGLGQKPRFARESCVDSVAKSKNHAVGRAVALIQRRGRWARGRGERNFSSRASASSPTSQPNSRPITDPEAVRSGQRCGPQRRGRRREVQQSCLWFRRVAR